MEIGNRDYSKSELLSRVGRINQVGGVRRFTLQEGFERGTEIIQVDTGTGLRFWISPDKGMDIVEAEFCGSSLCWNGVNGIVHSAYYKDAGLGWLDSYSSGLLTTCGFSNVGSPCDDNGVHYGLHGQAHNTPAEGVSARCVWVGNECQIEVTGTVCECKMFGNVISLTRKITAAIGGNKIQVEDKIENLCGASVPLMLLYHCNFGFPLLTEKTQIIMPSASCEHRNGGAASAPELWQEPVINYQEKVYLHSDLITNNNIATARLINPEFPVGGRTVNLQLEMNWDTTNLPKLVEWYMPGCGTHALGIEPANCSVQGRAVERESGNLVILESGETKTYSLSFEISQS